jgi:hypothetical protein
VFVVEVFILSRKRRRDQDVDKRRSGKGTQRSNGRAVSDDTIVDSVVGADRDVRRAVDSDVKVDILRVTVRLKVDGVKVGLVAAVDVVKVREGGRGALVDIDPEDSSGVELGDLDGERAGHAGHLELVVLPLVEGDVGLAGDAVGEVIERRAAIVSSKTSIAVAATSLGAGAVVAAGVGTGAALDGDGDVVGASKVAVHSDVPGLKLWVLDRHVKVGVV